MTNWIVGGGSVSGITLGADDTMEVLAGGSAVGTYVGAGASMTLDAATYVLFDGSIIFESGGAATSTTIYVGGLETVMSGARDTNALVYGNQVIQAGGSAVGTTVIDGEQDVYGYASGA